MNEIVKFVEVKKFFGGVSALSGASFTIPAGSVTALLGANGAGKSTALKMMVGLEKPSRGNAIVLEKDSRKIGSRELARIGYVAEGMELPDWMTVGELMDWCRPLYPEWDRALEKKLGELFLLPMDRKLKDLSRGQRMKAALWSVLSYRPELLILDEPFSGLDPVVRDDLTRSVLELAESEQWAVVIATHDIGEVENLADRVVVMRYGKVELEGDREEMLEKWRRVELLVPDGWEEPTEYPCEWLGVERMGKVLRFYESAYGEGFEGKMAEVLPGLGEAMVERISLRNLLGFEWKRIKWLVVAAWVFLAMAFVPRLSDALGIWNHDWSDAEDFLTGVGIIGFLLAGLFLAIWSGLVGRKLYPARPVLAGEIRVVSLGVLLGGLVAPVVLLTLLSMWLYGFSAEVMWRNVGMTVLAVMPLWLGVRLFARYAGSFKIMVVGLVMMAGLMVFGDSLRLKGVMEPWVNGIGAWLSADLVGVTWVFLFLLLCGWPLVRRRAAGLRMGVAVGCAVVSWLAVDRIAKREGVRSQIVGEMESKIEWTGEQRVSAVRNGLMVFTFHKAWSDDGERLTQWMMDEDFKDKEGQVLRAPKSNSHKWINRENKTLALRKRISEGKVFYEDGGNDPVMIDADLEAKRSGSVRGYVDGGALGESQGRLKGAVMELEKLVEVPLDGEGTFQRDGMIGSVRWDYYRLDEGERPVIRMKDATLNHWVRGRDESPLKDLVFMISYPKSGFVVEGQIGRTGQSLGMVGGLKEWSGWVRYRNNIERQPRFVEGDLPVLTVWQMRVVEEGWCEATIPAVGLGLEPRTNYGFLPLVEQGSGSRDPNVSERPDPETATRGEVGGWLRRVGALRNYEPRLGEFGEYGERFGDVFIGLGAAGKRFHRWNVGKTFLESGDNQWRGDLVNSLGRVKWAPEVLVKRGWAENARDQVEELLAGGTRSDGVLKLGIYLGAEGIEEALFEALGQSESPDLYEIARTLPKFEERRSEVLDERRAILERRMKARWSDYRDRKYFKAGGWAWLLSQGRVDDLESFLFWVKRSYANPGRRHSLPAEGSVIARAQKWEVEFFSWEPVLQKWVFNEKGKLK